jgi:Fe-S-cluster containining protein
MKISVKQLIPQDFCLQCRGCCRFSQQQSIWQPHLLEEEKKALGEIIVVASPEENNFICSNLGRADNKCKIYGRRPFECQLYPFLFDRKNNKVFLALDLNCAFARESSKDRKFKEYARSLAELVQGKDYLDMLKNNPLLAQEYEGVIDLIEIKV